MADVVLETQRISRSAFGCKGGGEKNKAPTSFRKKRQWHHWCLFVELGNRRGALKTNEGRGVRSNGSTFASLAHPPILREPSRREGHVLYLEHLIATGVMVFDCPKWTRTGKWFQ